MPATIIIIAIICAIVIINPFKIPKEFNTCCPTLSAILDKSKFNSKVIVKVPYNLLKSSFFAISNTYINLGNSNLIVTEPFTIASPTFCLNVSIWVFIWGTKIVLILSVIKSKVFSKNPSVLLRLEFLNITIRGDR